MQTVLEAIRKETEAMKSTEVLTYLLELKLVKNNATLGIAAVQKHEQLLKERYKKYLSPAPRLMQLLEALEEASHAVERARPVAGGNREMASAVFADREVLMTQLMSFGKTGLVPQRDVDAIVAGRGSIDAAEDVLEFARLIERYEAAKAKVITPAAELEAMVARAEAYLAVARPADFHGPANEALEAAIDTQCRVWTLVVRQHEALWKLGAEIYGKDVDAHVLPLGSRVMSRKKKSPDAAPGPVS